MLFGKCILINLLEKALHSVSFLETMSAAGRNHSTDFAGLDVCKSDVFSLAVSKMQMYDTELRELGDG